MWDLKGEKVHDFDGEETLRVHDLAISPDGQRLVVLLEKRILVYDFVSYEKLYQWPLERVKLTSVTISQDSRHMLVSMNDDKIALMEIDTGITIRDYMSHVQRQYVIRSTFGGAGEHFVVSGSEGESLPFLPYHGSLLVQIPASISGERKPVPSSELSMGILRAALTLWHGTPKTPEYSLRLVMTAKCASGCLRRSMDRRAPRTATVDSAICAICIRCPFYPAPSTSIYQDIMSAFLSVMGVYASSRTSVFIASYVGRHGSLTGVCRLHPARCPHYSSREFAHAVRRGCSGFG
jgi:hypothetical protein